MREILLDLYLEYKTKEGAVLYWKILVQYDTTPFNYIKFL